MGILSGGRFLFQHNDILRLLCRGLCRLYGFQHNSLGLFYDFSCDLFGSGHIVRHDGIQRVSLNKLLQGDFHGFRLLLHRFCDFRFRLYRLGSYRFYLNRLCNLCFCAHRHLAAVFLGFTAHIGKLDAKARIGERRIQRFLLRSLHIQPTGRCVQRAVGNIAAQRLGILAVTVDLGFKNGHLLGDAQGVELQPPRGAGQSEPQLFVPQVKAHHVLPGLAGNCAAQEFQRVKAGYVVQCGYSGVGCVQHRFLIPFHGLFLPSLLHSAGLLQFRQCVSFGVVGLAVQADALSQHGISLADIGAMNRHKQNRLMPYKDNLFLGAGHSCIQ